MDDKASMPEFGKWVPSLAIITLLIALAALGLAIFAYMYHPSASHASDTVRSGGFFSGLIDAAENVGQTVTRTTDNAVGTISDSVTGFNLYKAEADMVLKVERGTASAGNVPYTVTVMNGTTEVEAVTVNVGSTTFDSVWVKVEAQVDAGTVKTVIPVTNWLDTDASEQYVNVHVQKSIPLHHAVGSTSAVNITGIFTSFKPTVTVAHVATTGVTTSGTADFTKFVYQVPKTANVVRIRDPADTTTVTQTIA